MTDRSFQVEMHMASPSSPDASSHLRGSWRSLRVYEKHFANH